MISSSNLFVARFAVIVIVIQAVLAGRLIRAESLPSPPPTSDSAFSVSVIVRGEIRPIEQGQSLRSTVTLIRDHGYNIVVDSPSATDIAAKNEMEQGLAANGLHPGNVQYVVTTHGHPDHFGQGVAFPNSRHFFGSYEYMGNIYLRTELAENDEMPLTTNVQIWNTPGHTNHDISVIVSNVPGYGRVAVTGDLFYNEQDANLDSELWLNDAWNVEVGLRYRVKVLCAAAWIVPGHGNMFRVTREMKLRHNCDLPEIPTPASGMSMSYPGPQDTPMNYPGPQIGPMGYPSPSNSPMGFENSYLVMNSPPPYSSPYKHARMTKEVDPPQKRYNSDPWYQVPPPPAIKDDKRTYHASGALLAGLLNSANATHIKTMIRAITDDFAATWRRHHALRDFIAKNKQQNATLVIKKQSIDRETVTIPVESKRVTKVNPYAFEEARKTRSQTPKPISLPSPADEPVIIFLPD